MSWFFRIASLTLLAAKIGQGEKQEGRLAVVKSIYGAYDAPIDVKIADASGLVDYYLFTDEFLDTSDLKMTKVVTTPFHLRDPSSQVPGAKNSLDGIPLNPLFRGKPKFLRMRLNMMAIKYYKMMAWKVPLLANYNYIMHVDANFLLSNPNLRRDALKLLSNQTFLSTRHPRGWGGIQWEAIEATYQVYALYV